MERKPFPTDPLMLVLVLWEDSARSGEWTPFEELLSPHDVSMQSVGWVLEDTDAHLRIMPHIGTDPPQACGTMTIPKSCIQKMVKLEVPG